MKRARRRDKSPRRTKGERSAQVRFIRFEDCQREGIVVNPSPVCTEVTVWWPIGTWDADSTTID